MKYILAILGIHPKTAMYHSIHKNKHVRFDEMTFNEQCTLVLLLQQQSFILMGQFHQ